MRLPDEKLTVDEQLEEFDYWLTPYQVVYQTTRKFKQEMEQAVALIKSLDAFITKHQKTSLEVGDISHFINETSEILVTGKKATEDINAVAEHIHNVFQLLFLVTASSDNNLKSQFSVHLRTSNIGVEYSNFRFSKGKEAQAIDTKFTTSAVKAEALAKILAKYVVAGSPLHHATPVSALKLRERFNQLLSAYIDLIFTGSDPKQLYYLCKTYEYITSLASEGQDVEFGELLLKSSIIYKIRGSVTASEGHKNEHLMRERLKLLGLRGNIDFNLTDVVVTDTSVKSSSQVTQPKQKNRAFDFVLPYNVKGWRDDKTKIYIQAQFYAGDSGSVSHKVIDQTTSSRQALKLIKGDKHRFVEYLDGAGYASSLRGDLKKILEFSDTDSFVQIKSILVRLRREMQIIDYANPTDLAQAIYLSGSNNTRTEVQQIMEEKFRFSKEETNRAFESAIQQGSIGIEKGVLKILESELEEAARLTFILDHTVLTGQTLSNTQRQDSRYLIVPGYGRAHGALGSEIQKKITEISTALTEEFTRDTETLIEIGALKRGGPYT